MLPNLESLFAMMLVLGLGLALDLDCPDLVNMGLLISVVIETPKD